MVNAGQSQGSGAAVECRDRLSVEGQGAELDPSTGGAGGSGKCAEECGGGVEGQADDEGGDVGKGCAALHGNGPDPPRHHAQRTAPQEHRDHDEGPQQRRGGPVAPPQAERQGLSDAHVHEARGSCAHLCSWASRSEEHGADVTVWHIACCHAPPHPAHSPPPLPSRRDCMGPQQASGGDAGAGIGERHGASAVAQVSGDARPCSSRWE
ncbi:hypothetical protein CLOP_g11036 [Closterium sp. NIES-67]|nr:hypothetical protein CLOP_g11036 [Closterium sp. NIES-67]